MSVITLILATFEIGVSTQRILATIPVADCVPTIRRQKSILADYMDGAMPKPETIAEVIDSIERMRNELLDLQTVLEKMEVVKRFGEQDAPRIKKTER